MTDPSLGPGGRREAREDALAVLYESEITGDAAVDALDDRDVPPGPYAAELVRGVDGERAELDQLIERQLDNWRIDRLSRVDLVLARMASWELRHRSDVPTGVVLSEAVELAGQYSGADSPKFLNGLLRAVADEVRAER